MCRRQEAHQSRKNSTDALRSSAHPILLTDFSVRPELVEG